MAAAAGAAGRGPGVAAGRESLSGARAAAADPSNQPAGFGPGEMGVVAGGSRAGLGFVKETRDQPSRASFGEFLGGKLLCSEKKRERSK